MPSLAALTSDKLFSAVAQHCYNVGLWQQLELESKENFNVIRRRTASWPCPVVKSCWFFTNYFNLRKYLHVTVCPPLWSAPFSVSKITLCNSPWTREDNCFFNVLKITKTHRQFTSYSTVNKLHWTFIVGKSLNSRWFAYTASCSFKCPKNDLAPSKTGNQLNIIVATRNSWNLMTASARHWSCTQLVLAVSRL